MIQPNRIHINGLPFEFATASNIHILRGWQPAIFQFLVTNPTPWRALKNPVEIQVVTPGPDGAGDTLKLRKWYITAIEAHSSKMWQVTLQDVRWEILNRSFQGGWNIETADGQTRGDRTTSAPRAVTCVQAAIEALALLEADEPIIDVAPELASILLPKNMGDSAGGGYTAGTLRDVAAFLELARCDMVPNPDGRLIFVDRFRERSQKLKKTPTFAGFIANRDVHWTKPQDIVVTFEQMIERAFEIDLGGQTTVAPGPFDLPIKNVCPNFDPLSAPRLREDGSEIVNWVDLEEFVTTFVGYASYDDFLAKFNKLTGLTLPPNPTAAQRFLHDFHRTKEGIARDALFSIWQVDLKKTGIGRIYTGVRLGRLGPKGVNLPAAHTFCDYHEVGALAVPRVGGGPPCTVALSRPYPFDPNTPAPFVSHWVSDGQYGLVFEIRPVGLRYHGVEIRPGLANRAVHDLDPQDVSNGQYEVTRDQTFMLPNFRMRMFWNGLLAAPVAYVGRLHKITIPAFKDGQVRSIEIKANNVTANWGWEENKFPGVLLNKADLQQRAENIARQVMRTFSDGKSGIVVSSGIHHLKNTWVGGNIYEAVIEIGSEVPWSINTRFVVMPEVLGPVVESPEDLDGVKPALIG